MSAQQSGEAVRFRQAPHPARLRNGAVLPKSRPPENNRIVEADRFAVETQHAGSPVLERRASQEQRRFAAKLGDKRRKRDPSAAALYTLIELSRGEPVRWLALVRSSRISQDTRIYALAIARLKDGIASAGDTWEKYTKLAKRLTTE